MATKLYIGIDIGGTKISAGVVTDKGRILERVKIPTPANSTPKVIVTAILRLCLLYTSPSPRD